MLEKLIFIMNIQYSRQPSMVGVAFYYLNLDHVHIMEFNEINCHKNTLNGTFSNSSFSVAVELDFEGFMC